MATFENISEHAHEIPVISSLPPLAGFYLDNFAIYGSLDEFHRDLYDPDHYFDDDVIINSESRHPEYPHIECTADPFTPALNDAVAWDNREHHDQMRNQMLQQSDIKDAILNKITGEDFVALVIIDGLSYDAVRSLDFDIQPVVVDGITTTDPGFRRIIFGGDSASIYAELTSMGFYTGYGFTYWERGQEDLSTDLHSAMGQKTHRIRDFDEALDTLKADLPISDKTYVQITRMGLDQDSHSRKEEPNRDRVRDIIVDDLEALAETAADISDNFRIFMTADHGILWRKDLPEDPEIVYGEWADHARYLDGKHDLDHGLVEQGENSEPVTGLAYPYLTRDLKHDEWGAHGGFSYHESIVPLIEVDIAGETV